MRFNRYRVCNHRKNIDFPISLPISPTLNTKSDMATLLWFVKGAGRLSLLRMRGVGGSMWLPPLTVLEK